ncbi:MFS transporter [Dietzia maris]|uniref:MFS transporter n=1 Tax=Dietzia maris TaxID=37915 RepID=A0ABT8H5C8_9ACTN|nr:MFS transporter [Dietzia maris]MDN4507668.1 MFS transporter [Dietzia maris]ODQ93332.1 MFS transporter [Dietzia alimentaria]
MIGVLRNSTYARLFSAQIVALLGTGLLTVALGLLAFDIAGQDAGVVLGTALTIKMVAYVAVSPVMAAMATRWRRKAVLVSADAVRAAVALSLPWVSEAWQIYVLIFALQAASATFTPVFQAVIPDVLPDGAQYTRALSLSRLAYDTESLLSPVLAAALLAIMSYNNLFLGTVLGFLASGALVLVTEIPDGARSEAASFRERLTRGVRVMLRTTELRSLLVMNLIVATSTAMVIVNTVVVVRGSLDRSESDVALLLAAFGAGSMLVALVVPRVLDKIADRPVMLTGSAIIPPALAASAAVIALPAGSGQWALLITLWAILGAATSLILTPSARLLRRASDQVSRPAVFAAQFSLSHACFMLTYPIAGVLGAMLGLPQTALILSALGVLGAFGAFALWTRPVA